MSDLTTRGIAEAVAAQRWFRDTARRATVPLRDRRRYNLGVTLPHPQRKAVVEALWAAAEQNDLFPKRRRVVGIDGDFKAGKSQLMATLDLEYTQNVWARTGTEIHDGDRHTVLPVFYASASASGEADLARAVAECLGVPLNGRETAPQILAGIRNQCANSRTVFGVIDDANMLTTSRRGTNLTQFLKRMMDDLPVTLAFVGKGLSQTPVLRPASTQKPDADAAEQLARRMTRVEIQPILPDVAGAALFVSLVAAAAQRFLLASPGPAGDLGPEDFAWLHSATQGRVGDLYEILTVTAAAAVGTDEKLTGAGLRRAHQSLTAAA